MGNISHINIGCGKDLTISELVSIIARVVGFGGNIQYDSSKPDGAPRKLLNSSRLLSMGWSARTSLKDGLKKTYAWFLKCLDDSETLPRGVNNNFVSN